MTFLEQSKKAQGPSGIYLITLSITLLAFLLVGFATSFLAQNVFHFELGVGSIQGSDKNLYLALQLLPFLGSLTAVLLCVKFIHKQPVLSVFTAREYFDWKRFFLSFSIWGGVLTFFLVLGIIMGADVSFEFKPSTFFQLVLVSLILIPIQTTAEDILFRGVLFQGLGAGLKSGLMAILILGGVFGYLHAGNPEVAILGKGILIFYIVSGIFLGLLTHLDDGMELGMGYHVVNNIFGALILTNNWQAFQTDALFVDYSPPFFGWELILTMCLLQPLLLIVFYKIYKWKNVKEKFLS